MRKILKKVIASLLLLSICLTSMMIQNDETKAYASTKFITRETFMKLVMKELKFNVDETSSKHPYIDAAIRSGIITENTFGSNYNTYLTKSDVAVVLVNAHEFLYNDSLPESLVSEIIEKRISDIKSVSKARRTYVAKAYAYGYLKGNSNGQYSSDRAMKSWQKVSASGAKSLVAMLRDKSKRSKIADDGQLIRTTNLPSNAKMYPYILASFPNAYYDWEFQFQKALVDVLKEGSTKIYTKVPRYTTQFYQSKKLELWAPPVDIKDYYKGKTPWIIEYPAKFASTETVLALGLDKWVENAKKYLTYAFNIDYRTIKKDKDWYNTILSLDCENGLESQSSTENFIKQYIKAVVDNKTIIECDKVAVDKSTLYAESGFYIRCYVHYRVISSKNTSSYSALAYTKGLYTDYDKIKLGEWRDGYFDLKLDPAYGNFTIDNLIISDYFYKNKVVTD